VPIQLEFHARATQKEKCEEENANAECSRSSQFTFYHSRRPHLAAGVTRSTHSAKNNLARRMTIRERFLLAQGAKAALVHGLHDGFVRTAC